MSKILYCTIFTTENLQYIFHILFLTFLTINFTPIYLSLQMGINYHIIMQTVKFFLCPFHNKDTVDVVSKIEGASIVDICS